MNECYTKQGKQQFDPTKKSKIVFIFIMGEGLFHPGQTLSYITFQISTNQNNNNNDFR